MNFNSIYIVDFPLSYKDIKMLIETNLNETKSTGGYMFALYSGATTCKSLKQNFIAKYTFFYLVSIHFIAKYTLSWSLIIILKLADKKAKWLRNFLPNISLGVTPTSYVFTYCNCQAAIA